MSIKLVKSMSQANHGIIDNILKLKNAVNVRDRGIALNIQAVYSQFILTKQYNRKNKWRNNNSTNVFEKSCQYIHSSFNGSIVGLIRQILLSQEQIILNLHSLMSQNDLINFYSRNTYFKRLYSKNQILKLYFQDILTKLDAYYAYCAVLSSFLDNLLSGKSLDYIKKQCRHCKLRVTPFSVCPCLSKMPTFEKQYYERLLSYSDKKLRIELSKNEITPNKQKNGKKMVIHLKEKLDDENTEYVVSWKDSKLVLPKIDASRYQFMKDNSLESLMLIDGLEFELFYSVIHMYSMIHISDFALYELIKESGIFMTILRFKYSSVKEIVNDVFKKFAVEQKLFGFVKFLGVEMIFGHTTYNYSKEKITTMIKKFVSGKIDNKIDVFSIDEHLNWLHDKKPGINTFAHYSLTDYQALTNYYADGSSGAAKVDIGDGKIRSVSKTILTNVLGSLEGTNDFQMDKNLIVLKKERLKIRLVVATSIQTFYPTCRIMKVLGLYFKNQLNMTTFSSNPCKIENDFICRKCLNRGDWLLSVDYSAFDHTISWKFMYDTFLLYVNKIGQLAPHLASALLEDLRLIDTLINSEYVYYDDLKIKYEKGMLSGWRFTNGLESILNIMITVVILTKLGILHLLTYINTMGDDNLTFISNKVYALKGWKPIDLMNEFVAIAAVHGFEVSAKKSMPSNHVYEYLKTLNYKYITLQFTMRQYPAVLFFKPDATEMIVEYQSIVDSARKISSRSCQPSKFIELAEYLFSHSRLRNYREYGLKYLSFDPKYKKVLVRNAKTFIKPEKTLIFNTLKPFESVLGEKDYFSLVNSFVNVTTNQEHIEKRDLSEKNNSRINYDLIMELFNFIDKASFYDNILEMTRRTFFDFSLDFNLMILLLSTVKKLRKSGHYADSKRVDVFLKELLINQDIFKFYGDSKITRFCSMVTWLTGFLGVADIDYLEFVLSKNKISTFNTITDPIISKYIKTMYNSQLRKNLLRSNFLKIRNVSNVLTDCFYFVTLDPIFYVKASCIRYGIPLFSKVS